MDEQQLPDKVKKENDFQNDGINKVSKEIELLYEGKKIIVIIEQYISNEVDITDNDSEDLNNCDHQDVNFGRLNIDYTAPLDLVDQVLDDSTLQCKSIINYHLSKGYHPISSEIKSVMKQIIEKNKNILGREELLRSSEQCLHELETQHLVENVKIMKCNEKECSQTKQKYETNRMCEQTWHVEFVHSRSEVVPTPLRQIHTCHICDYSTLTKSNLTKHVSARHLNIRNFKCHLCEFSASIASNLKVHLKCVHLKQKHYSCNFCDYSASRKHQLNQHIQVVHTNIKKFKCQLCDYTGTVKDYLRKHQAVHLKKKKLSTSLNFENSTNGAHER